MPPKRKSDAQASAQQKKSKNNESEAHENGEGSGSQANAEEVVRQPHDYVVIPRHMFDVENENDEKPEDEQLDEDELEDKFKELVGVDKSGKPASEFPGYKWIGMNETQRLSNEYRIQATYTDPDMFGMYIYNDFYGYGVLECIQNALMGRRQLLAIDNEFKKKSSDRSVEQMWALSAALIHWIVAENGPWIGADDGEQVKATANLIGRAFLSTLNELDLAGLLQADGPIKDLGLVIAICLYWSHDLDDYGIEETKNFKWRKEVIAYAKKAKVDFKEAGLFRTDSDVKTLEEIYGEVAPLSGDAKADRWGWKKAVTAHGKKYGSGGKMGGDKYNILKMSRTERAKYAFDHKDPLAEFSVKDLREGNLMAV
ncbi:hypothetical protein SCAR479_01880 [Seiridium cardinale]|uniref:Uncharacterized protein n=1 Tax=Seiridium cardinale TaxID=138064 RepID=A0ABR2Y409_9PEZI